MSILPLNQLYCFPTRFLLTFSIDSIDYREGHVCLHGENRTAEVATTAILHFIGQLRLKGHQQRRIPIIDTQPFGNRHCRALLRYEGL